MNWGRSSKPLGSRAASVFEAVLGGRRHLVHPDDVNEADAFWDWLGDLERPAEAPEAPKRSRIRFASMAAVLALAVSTATYWQFRDRGGSDDFVESYLSARAERRVIELADGSVINLAPESQINLHYSPTERRIRLLGGQGLFDVASDPKRPFIVEVAQGEVRAVGTSFDVIAGRDETSVTVVEGVVRILLAGQDKKLAGGVKEARKGELVRFGTSNSGGSRISFISQSNGADVNNATAWTRGVLIFKGEPLARVIETVNLYSQETVHLNDPSLKDRPVFGVIRQGDASALKELIANPDLIEISDE